MSINTISKQHSVHEIEQGIMDGYVVNTLDDIHIIGEYDTKTHHTFNKDKKTTKHMHTFTEYEHMLGIGLVYIQSLNIILLIGGYNNRHLNDTICQIFDLETNKWKKIDNIKFPYYRGEALLTKDEKHIIITTKYQGGSDRHDEIFIVDIIDKSTFELRQSRISSPTIKRFESCPQRVMCLNCGTTTSGKNELLVNGFIRRENKDEISTDVVGIICMFCDDELLHCLRIGKENNPSRSCNV